jgi:hypothetical protein
MARSIVLLALAASLALRIGVAVGQNEWRVRARASEAIRTPSVFLSVFLYRIRTTHPLDVDGRADRALLTLSNKSSQRS